jgi:hypothetical protein
MLEAKATLGEGTKGCLADWNNETYPCDGSTRKWSGLCVCSQEGLVEELCLAECGFNGKLPVTWGALPGMEDLRILFMNSNTLKGPLPPSWGGLRELQYMRLYDNQLTGPLPAEWSGLTKAWELYLMRNNLEGPLPASWGGLSTLQQLLLHGNTGINGTIPCSWTGMSRLYLLGVGNTGLQGCYPSEQLKFYATHSSPSPPATLAGVRGE